MSLSVGRLVSVENTGNVRGSSHYNQLTFVNDDGDVEQILMTNRELDSARQRSEKNQNDLSDLSLIDRLAALCVRSLAGMLSLFGL